MDQNWREGLTEKDWLFDGSPIRGAHMLEAWNDLDWSKAWMDMGPSVAGNPGPYWHVPRIKEDTTHRLYPKVLTTKWLPLIRHAITTASKSATEARAKAFEDAAALAAGSFVLATGAPYDQGRVDQANKIAEALRQLAGSQS